MKRRHVLILIAMMVTVVFLSVAAGYAYNCADLSKLRSDKVCIGCDLSGAHLEGANLEGTNLRGTILEFESLGTKGGLPGLPILRW